MIATDACHHSTNEIPKCLIYVTRMIYIKASDGKCANLFASYRNYMSAFTTVAINRTTHLPPTIENSTQFCRLLAMVVRVFLMEETE